MLQRGDSRPLRSIVAGPGWGKTTLAASWALQRGCAWYTLGPEDSDAARLAAGLAAAAPAEALDLRGDDPVELASQLADAWTRSGGVDLVIDDVQLLRGRPALELVRELVSATGPSLRLLLLATEDLDLVDDRRRGGGHVLELDAANLAMGSGTVADLLEEELEPDGALASRIADGTGGWPAAIRLVIEALRAVPAAERSARVTALTGSSGPVAGYLLGVVLPNLGDDARHTLLRVALLGSANPAVLAAAAGNATADIAAEVRSLVQRGLLRWEPSGEEGEVTLSPAVRRVLLAWSGPTAGERDRLVSQVVDGLMAHGHGGRALAVLTEAGRPEGTAEILERHGDRLLQVGQLEEVIVAAAGIPAELRTPRIERLHGHALAYRGEWSAALACLAKAGALPSGPLPTDLALPLGLAHHLRGDLEAALDAFTRAPEEEDTVDHAVLDSWRATANWLRGDREEARRFADRALDAAQTTGDDRALAHAHTAQALIAASDGDRRANEAHYRQALTAAVQAGDAMQQARILTNLGSHHLEAGRYDEASRETEAAIDLASSLGYVPILGVAWCNRAEISLRTGALDQAVADATAARELFARIGSRNESYAEHLLGDARREQGELVLARVAYDRAIRLAGPAGDHQGLVPAHIGLAKTLASTDPDAAAEVASRALELDGGGMGRAAALLANAWVAFARGDREAASSLATEALEDAERREDRSAVAGAVTCLGLLDEDPLPRLREAVQRWQEVDAPISRTRVELGVARRSERPEERARAASLERRLASFGCPPDRGDFVHRLVVGAELRPRTTIRVLGGFVVERAGHPVPRSAWGSRKARELLKVLVVRGGRPATREELADLLWPDEPYDAVTNRLSVALSVVRGVLAGDDADRDTAPVRSDDDTVHLDPDAVDIDLVRFRGLAEDGLRAARAGEPEAAIAALTAAEEAYGGDLLEEDRDATWLIDRREELRSLYVSVARSLAGLVVDEDPDLAMRLLLRVLDRDGYDEPAHLEICRALLRAGRHGEARRRHRIYAERMEELDLPAVPFHDVRRAGGRSITAERTSLEAAAS